MGLQPFIERGWIDMGRMFSTFGVNGLYEANIILQKRFGKHPEDYKKDILEHFNVMYRKTSQELNIAGNAEQTPVESMSPKLFKADNMLFGNPCDFPNMYANQFVPLWKKGITINEKLREEGKYDSYLNGGQICHLGIGSDITSSQAKQIICASVDAGCEHFAINAVYSRCKDCGEVEKANWKVCPKCGSANTEHLSRVVGFFVVMENINETRKINDWEQREFITKDELKRQFSE